MGLSNRTRVDYLQSEGILTVADLSDWEDDEWYQWCSNCKNPDRIHDQEDGAAVGALINQVPFSVPARSLKRLKIASRIVRYYNSVGIDLTVTNICWTVMDNFNVLGNYLKDKPKETAPNVSNLLPSMNVTKLNDATNVHSSQVFGDRKSNLSYIIREDAAFPEVAPSLLLNQPNSVEAGSIQAEMTTRLSQNHQLLQNDNTSLYGILEEAALGTIYEDTIKPFHRTNDGCGS